MRGRENSLKRDEQERATQIWIVTIRSEMAKQPPPLIQRKVSKNWQIQIFLKICDLVANPKQSSTTDRAYVVYCGETCTNFASHSTGLPIIFHPLSLSGIWSLLYQTARIEIFGFDPFWFILRWFLWSRNLLCHVYFCCLPISLFNARI